MVLEGYKEKIINVRPPGRTLNFSNVYSNSSSEFYGQFYDMLSK